MPSRYKSIVNILQNRELGFYHHNQKRPASELLRSLFRNNSSTFQSNGKLVCRDGLYVCGSDIYSEKLTRCHNFSLQKAVEKFSFRFPYKKLHDFSVIYTDELKVAPIPVKEFRNAFYCLAGCQVDSDQGNILYVQDMETGEILHEIFLSLDRNCKFRYTYHENEVDRVYINSTLNYNLTDSLARPLFSVIVFTVKPLKLMAAVDFYVPAVGKYLKKAYYQNELMFIMNGSSSSNLNTKIYLFDQVLCEENRLFNMELNQYCNAIEAVVGIKPHGIPSNYKVLNMPAPLFSVACGYRSVIMRSLPGLYFFSSPNQEGIHVRDLGTHSEIGIVGNVAHNYTLFNQPDDEVLSMTSYSNEFMFNDYNEIFVYDIKLKDDLPSFSKKRLHLKYQLKFPLNHHNEEEESGRPRKRQRKASRNVSYNSETEANIVAMDYSYFELLIVLVNDPQEASTGIVYIIDFPTGEIMSKFNTPIPISDKFHYDIYIDEAIIFISQCRDKSLTAIYRFEMNRNEEFIKLNPRRPFSSQLNPNVSYKKIEKLLIANRGEIACRIMKTARRLGIETVAVFSDADRHSMHVSMADQAYHIGPSPATESYLVKERLIDMALKSGSNAIHPGYGFLSENFEFATTCLENGIQFVGPPASAIKSMGIKSLSKSIMIDAGVPVIPGFHDDNQQDSQFLLTKAKEIGFPIMIKAVRGGGGKGMRIAINEAEFLSQLESARREAMKAFGDDVVLLEKFVRRPRHIEVQVFGDQHGNCVHLFERDCSSQRRHQKVIEEAPAPHVTPEIRNELGTAAVKAAKAVNYSGAGTVEFIFDTNDEKFYFMEMNTRLQVEHPVTEMVTGIDLVEWQLRVANGEVLPRSQSDFVHPKGHSFEARVYAEDADNNFMPCTGTIQSLRVPDAGSDVRIETGVRDGDEVSVYYDPMIAKLVVWDHDRRSALMKLCKCLNEYRIAGFKTNIDYLIRLASHPKFQSGDVYTDFIAEHSEDLKKPTCSDSKQLNLIRGISALAFVMKENSRLQTSYFKNSNDQTSPFNHVDGRWITGSKDVVCGNRMFRLKNTFASEDAFEVRVHFKGDSRYLVEALDSNGQVGDSFDVTATYDHKTGEMDLHFVQDGLRRKFTVLLHGEKSSTVFTREYGAFTYEMELPSFLEKSEAESGSDSSTFDGKNILSPMPALIEKIAVNSGDVVKNGDMVVVLTAMKMEHVINATFADGVDEMIVDQVLYKPGDSIPKGAKILKFKSD